MADAAEELHSEFRRALAEPASIRAWALANALPMAFLDDHGADEALAALTGRQRMRLGMAITRAAFPALSAILARVERLEGALKFYAHEWKWFPVGGENPTESHPGSPPEGYEAEPTAALIKDGGDRAHRALAVLSPKPEGRS